MSSLAQEESRSISENCTWGQRKRFADGKVCVPYKRFLGYDMGPDHNLVVNPEQAKLVKRIYGMFLLGKSPFQIASTLTAEGIPSPGGKPKWNASNIRSILTNEKYKGDALLQKTYTGLLHLRIDGARCFCKYGHTSSRQYPQSPTARFQTRPD